MKFLPHTATKLASRAMLGGTLVLLLSASACSDEEDGTANAAAANADFRSFVLDAFANTDTTSDPTPINDLDLGLDSSLEPDAFISLLEGN